jgi:8-oxo-dGTP pyrophosphatase MutT (NUDIX family)
MQQNGRESDFHAINLQKRASQLLALGASSAADEASGDLHVPKDGLCPAAVLVPIVNRDGDTHVLLTKRADDHPHHAGQISFPGGKIARDDKTIEAAALRETLEETGIEARYIELLGHLDAHKTGTGFTIYPVVALLEPTFDLKPCAREVAEIFEVPLSFLMNSDNYRIEEMIWRGRAREFYMIDYDGHQIWGATAAILKMLQERLYKTK